MVDGVGLATSLDKGFGMSMVIAVQSKEHKSTAKIDVFICSTVPFEG